MTSWWARHSFMFGNSTGDLAQHKESEHLDLLQLPKFEDKYAKERQRLGAEPLDGLSPSEVASSLCETILEEEGDSELQDPNLSNGKLRESSDFNSSGELSNVDDSITFSLPINGGLLESDYAADKTSSTDSPYPESSVLNTTPNSSDATNLKPLRIRRSYCCDQCGLLTSDPREYLYHCRDVHGERISVHECKYCIYASKHVQKLQRHCNLVHPQQVAKEKELKKQREAEENELKKKREAEENELRKQREAEENEIRKQREAQESELRKQREEQANELKKQLEAYNVPVEKLTQIIKKRNQIFFKCTACNYQTRNKVLMQHHEKTVHYKKKLFRCLKCGYATNEKSRYARHLKYHNLPKIQCEFCFFKTAYKWNMDRHMKNHVSGSEGGYSCTLCNFNTATKQSLTQHVTNHHNVKLNEDLNQQNIMDFNDKGSYSESQWEDINVYDDEDMMLEENELSMTEEFSTDRTSYENSWNQQRGLKKPLKCQLCEFTASWPFELKKHEENHKSTKRHECPLCGMRFEHIAWLTKHLNRIHKGNAQAKNFVEAFESMKPSKKKPIKDCMQSANVLPIYQEVFKQTGTAAVNRPQNSPRPSMLSTLLKNPLPTTLNKFATSKQKQSLSLSRQAQQTQISNYLVPPKPSLVEAPKLKSKAVPTCNFCGYKTRWSSELERHMRVHTQEKPFQCPKCKYHCKWKGDLNRHLMKYHGVKVPTKKKNMIPKLKLKKAPSSKFHSANDWETVNQEMNHHSLSTSGSTEMRVRSSVTEDSPLDLRLSKSTFPHPYLTKDPYDIYEFDSTPAPSIRKDAPEIQFSDTEELNSSEVIPSSSESKTSDAYAEDGPGTKKKYQCPFCVFSTTTASRFHVHIVQHYNKRPFMCSLCSYRSNWEWDITKHIRQKGCKDKSHNKACVLLTDETGRRNYDKYEKYLVDIDYKKPRSTAGKDNDMQTRFQRRESCEIANKKNCTYDFKNIASNFESDPVSMIVNPDMGLAGVSDNSEQNNSILSARLEANLGEKYYCKHCNYKHSTKRVIVSHLSVHAGLKPFRCRTCGLASNWRHVIVKHIKDLHDGNMANVEDRIMFTQEGYGIRLTAVNTGSKDVSTSVPKSSARFGCKICPYTCDKEYYIKFHMKHHRPQEGAIYYCTYCPYYVKFKKSLAKHIKLHVSDHSSAKNFADNFHSQENFGDYSDGTLANNYYNSMNYKSPFEDMADDSLTTFNQLQSVADDQTLTSKVKRHICKHCPYNTDNKTQYLYHKQFHRPNSSAPFKCTTCSYWATMQHLLTQHMKVHFESNTSSENNSFETESFEDLDSAIPEQISIVYIKREGIVVKMFKCNHCPMMNKKRANVRVHQKMHGVIVKNGKFACSFCDYQCLNQGGLTNHIKIHRKNRGKSFLNRSEADLDVEKSTVSQEQEPSSDLLGIRSSFSITSYSKKLSGFSYFCMKCPGLFKSSQDFNVHSKFHGSSLPLPCPYCDYRARNKPHLTKHLFVHTPGYIKKRNSSHGPPVNVGTEQDNLVTFTDTSVSSKNVVGKKKIDQMLLLEASEIKASLQIPEEFATKLHTCVFCPASFYKTSTLAYHISLHGSGGEFKCSHCDYSVSRSENIDIHSRVHPEAEIKKIPVKRSLKTFCCPKCPAVFYKLDRFNRHFDLHGKNYRYVCSMCDYSVRFAANLNKHRNVHTRTVVSQNSVSSPVENNELIPLSTTIPDTVLDTSIPPEPLIKDAKTMEPDDKRVVYYICDRCPYAQNRKDAVQSHQRRHWLEDGLACPYCDYSSMNSGKLRDHVKMHIQQTQLFPAQAFMKYEKFEIWCKGDEDNLLLFEDKFATKSSSSDSSSDQEIEASKTQSLSKSNYIPIETSTAFRKMNESRQSKKSFPQKGVPNGSSPRVVLSDIFSSDKDLKKWVPEGNVSSLRKKLKLKNLLRLSSISNEAASKKNLTNGFGNEEEKKTQERLHKPNIVVKIKVENRVMDNHEKTTYSVSTNETETEDVPGVAISENDCENLLDNSQLELQVSNDVPDIDCKYPLENAQSELHVSNDISEYYGSEDAEQIRETVSDIESKLNIVGEIIEHVAGNITDLAGIAAVQTMGVAEQILADVGDEPESHKNEISKDASQGLVECVETVKLPTNLNFLTNGDIEHLRNQVSETSTVSDDVSVPI